KRVKRIEASIYLKYEGYKRDNFNGDITRIFLTANHLQTLQVKEQATMRTTTALLLVTALLALLALQSAAQSDEGKLGIGPQTALYQNKKSRQDFGTLYWHAHERPEVRLEPGPQRILCFRSWWVSGIAVLVFLSSRLTSNSDWISLPPLCSCTPGTHEIRGWNLGLKDMCIGEERKLTIPAPLAYGEIGNPEAKIPGNATLIFEIELMNIDPNIENRYSSLTKLVPYVLIACILFAAYRFRRFVTIRRGAAQEDIEFSALHDHVGGGLLGRGEDEDEEGRAATKQD
ncbi:hypothetical protein BC936DRAFT_139834, partial [Jimgerdemannia flammicorona]